MTSNSHAADRGSSAVGPGTRHGHCPGYSVNRHDRATEAGACIGGVIAILVLVAIITLVS